MLDLSEKTILVTGASKGIGAAIAGALGRQGARLVAHYGRDRNVIDEPRPYPGRIAFTGQAAKLHKIRLIP